MLEDSEDKFIEALESLRLLHPHDVSAHKLLKSNKNIATRDIFNLEFGEGSLEANGAAGVPDYDVEVKSIISSKDYSVFPALYRIFKSYPLGSVSDDKGDEKEIFLNYLRFSLTEEYRAKTEGASILKTLGHENLHIAQREIMKEGYVPFDRPFMKAFPTRPCKTLVSKWATAFLDTIRPSSDGAHIRYLQHDEEVQVRLHTIVSNAIHCWGKLPKDKNELFAALNDVGLRIPLNLADASQDSDFLPQNIDQDTSSVFRAMIADDVEDLNMLAMDYKTEKEEYVFWAMEVPYLYGHLLELYGIEDGREMMGFESPDVEHVIEEMEDFSYD